MSIAEPPIPGAATTAAFAPPLLASLAIRGFRCFRDLNIEKLGRVNLLVGRNNTGKSTILDAVGLYAQGGAAAALLPLLERRGEAAEVGEQPGSDRYGVDGLFFGRPAISAALDPIQIGPATEGGGLRIGVLRVDDSEAAVGAVMPLVNPRDPGLGRAEYGLLCEAPGQRWFYPLDDAGRLPPWGYLQVGPAKPSILVPPGGLDLRTAGSYWDETVLTPREDTLIGALRLVEPEIDRVTMAGGARRRPLARLRSHPHALPLSTLGDGVTRIFHLALALANATDGVLLIDEVENGLHHRVLDGLWAFVFEAAPRFGVQVFATTHSSDCVRAFVDAASATSEVGVLVRLQRRLGDLEASVYDEERLQFATQADIEVRG
jgi:hypothetical protein